MTSILPDRPDVAQLRRQAKELLRAAKAGDVAARERLAAIAGDPLSPTLTDAQTAIARESGFASWPKLRRAVAEAQDRSGGLRAVQPAYSSKTTGGAALFTADTFVEQAQQAGWKPGPLPDAIVFTFHAVYAKLLAEDARFEQNTRLAPSNSKMFTTVAGSPSIGVTCLSPGATAMVGQVENQVALGGADRFVIVGTAGTIRSDVKPGDVVVVSSAVRDDGISQHYLPPDTLVEADPALANRLSTALREQGVASTLGSTWTVPTPYRSTAEEVEQLAADGVATVECEVASLLAVAEALGVRAGACLSVTSSLVGHPSEPSLRPVEPTAVLEAALSALGLPEAS